MNGIPIFSFIFISSNKSKNTYQVYEGFDMLLLFHRTPQELMYSFLDLKYHWQCCDELSSGNDDSCFLVHLIYDWCRCKGRKRQEYWTQGRSCMLHQCKPMSKWYIQHPLGYWNHLGRKLKDKNLIIILLSNDRNLHEKVIEKV